MKARLTFLLILGMLALSVTTAQGDDCLELPWNCCSPPEPSGGAYSPCSLWAWAVWQDHNYTNWRVEDKPVIETCQDTEETFYCPGTEYDRGIWYFIIDNLHVYTYGGEQTLTWYGTGVSFANPYGWHATWDTPGITANISEHNTACRVKYSTPGIYTLTATVYDDFGGNAPYVAHWTVIVKPKPPKCPPPGSKQGRCDDSGGCGGGSCGDGGGEIFPMPSPQDPVVPTPRPALPAPVGQWTEITTDDDNDSCNKVRAEVFDTCRGFYVRLTTRCSCQVFGPFSKPESGEETHDYPLDDGGTLHIVLSSTGNVSATVSYPDGSQEHYTVPPPPETTFVSESGPDWVKDADGNETVITRGETYDTVTTPAGETWRYYHDRATGDPRITKIQRTDVANAPYVQINYVTEGNDGEGKPSSIQVRDASNNLLSETTYSYYPSGDIKTATNGDRQLFYEYSADPVKITVTERLTDSETVIYGKTEYWYGKIGELGLEDPPGEGRDESRPGQYATWVTRIDPANPANNQRTRYVYNHVTQENEEIRTYLHSVTDPLGTTTTSPTTHPNQDG